MIKNKDLFGLEAQVLFLELTKLSTLEEVTFDQFAQILLTSCQALFEVESASYWSMSSDGETMTCLASKEHETDSRLNLTIEKEAAPAYFEAILNKRIICADDATTNPATADFAEVYLPRFKVKSMLDAQVVSDKQLKGVICIESSTGRSWNYDEQNFLLGIVSVLSAALLNEQRIKTNNQLKAFSSNLKTVHDLAVLKSENMEEVFQQYLEKGCKMFGLPLGIVSQIENDLYTVLAFDSSIDFDIQDEITIDLNDTYCQKVINQNKTITFKNAGGDNSLAQHPAYINYQLESYMGTPLWVNDKIYGTLNFSSPSVMENNFSVEDVELLELMAHDLGQRIESELVNRDKAITETHLRQALKSLEKNENWISNLVNTIEGVVWECDTKTYNTSFVSQKALDIFGFPLEAWTNSGTFWTDHIHPDDRDIALKYYYSTINKGGIFSLKYRFQRAVGDYIWIQDIMTVSRKNNAPISIMGLMIDITTLVEKEQELEKTLQEKETLFKELHHRVKNNLSMVVNLLQLKSKMTRDPNLLEFIRDTRNRIFSIAKTHEQLIKLEEFNLLNSKQYIEALVANLISSYGADESTYTLQTEIEDHKLDIDTILAIGFLVNEIVTNSIKYAYDSALGGIISIQFHLREQFFHLKIGDQGKGFVPDDKKLSIGMNLIELFADQLSGVLKVYHKKGTSYHLIFPKPTNK